MRRAVVTLGALVWGFALGLVSAPWLFWALGRALCGDGEGADAVMDSAPISRWFEWVEAR